MTPGFTTYSALVRELFHAPNHAGSIGPGAQNVYRGEAGSVEQGAWVRFQLAIGRGHVTDARFRAYGCPHTLAAAEWVAQQAVGKGVSEALPSAAAIAAALQAPAEKLGRLLIVEDALRSCLQRASEAGVK